MLLYLLRISSQSKVLAKGQHWSVIKPLLHIPSGYTQSSVAKIICQNYLLVDYGSITLCLLELMCVSVWSLWTKNSESPYKYFPICLITTTKGLLLFVLLANSITQNARWQKWHNEVILTNYIGSRCFSEARTVMKVSTQTGIVL